MRSWSSPISQRLRRQSRRSLWESVDLGEVSPPQTPPLGAVEFSGRFRLPEPHHLLFVTRYLLLVARHELSAPTCISSGKLPSNLSLPVINAIWPFSSPLSMAR